jgi:hypothetical protein
MNRVALDRSARKAGRDSLTSRFPSARFLTMSMANRFTLSVAATIGWTLSWAQSAFA